MFDSRFSLKKAIPFFLIGVVIIFALTLITGIDRILEAISKTNSSIYALAFVVQVLAIMIWLSKWKILTQAIGLNVGARRMFPILLSGIFVNTVVPSGNVGGDPLRAYMFSELGEVPIGKSFATVVADRAVDGIPFIFIILASLSTAIFIWDISLYLTIVLLITSIFVIIVLIAFLYVSIRPKPAKSFIQWLIQKLRRIITKFRPIEYVERKVEEFMEGFAEGSPRILGNKRYAGPAVALSSIYWFLSILRMWIVFLALGEPVSLVTVVLALTLGLVLQIVPIPGGLGVVEGAYIVIFKAAGVPAGVALSAALLDRGVSFWFTSLFSATGIAWSGIKLSKTWES